MAYRPNPNMLNGIHSRYRECSAASDRAWREAHPEWIRANNESRRLPPTKLTAARVFSGRRTV